MTIRIEAYDRCPAAARAIREQVFIRERDWRPEFDEWDAASVHLLVFDSDNDAPNRPGSTAQLVFCFNVCSTGSAVFFRSVG